MNVFNFLEDSPCCIMLLILVRLYLDLRNMYSPYMHNAVLLDTVIV